MTAEEIKQLLPSIYQQSAIEGTPMMALLHVMSSLHQPVEEILQGFENNFSPYRTDIDFLPYLGSWFILDQYYIYEEGGRKIQFPTGTDRLRELIASFSLHGKWRGTSKGLITMLEMATGESGFSIDETVKDEQGHYQLFHILITAPASTAPQEKLIKSIVLSQKPAYVTYDIKF